METNSNPVVQAYDAGWQIDGSGEWWKPEVGQTLTVDYGSDEFEERSHRVQVMRVDNDSFDVWEFATPATTSWTIYLSELEDGIVTVLR